MTLLDVPTVPALSANAVAHWLASRVDLVVVVTYQSPCFPRRA